MRERELNERPALVVCDLLGTTMQADDIVPQAFAAVLASEGVNPTVEDIAAVRGANKREALLRLLPPGPDLSGRAERAYTRLQERLRAAYTPQNVRPVPGAAAVLRALRAEGLRVALNTGFERALTDQLLRLLDWEAIADVVVCGDEVAHGRPAPDMIRRAMALCGVAEARRVVNVGDTVLDLQAGAAAGVGWNIGVWSGAHDRARLAAVPHTRLLASVAELPEALGLAG